MKKDNKGAKDNPSFAIYHSSFRSKGYTLIELILYISIVGMLLTSITMYFGSSTEARVKNQSIVEVNQQGAFATGVITQAIRGATSITTPTAGNSGSSLTLVVPTGADSPTVFDLSSGVLRSKKGAATAVALTNGKVQVTSLTFTNLTRSGTSGIIRVSFTISRVNAANKNEYDYQKTFTASAAVRP